MKFLLIVLFIIAICFFVLFISLYFDINKSIINFAMKRSSKRLNNLVGKDHKKIQKIASINYFILSFLSFILIIFTIYDDYITYKIKVLLGVILCLSSILVKCIENIILKKMKF